MCLSQGDGFSPPTPLLFRAAQGKPPSYEDLVSALVRKKPRTLAVKSALCTGPSTLQSVPRVPLKSILHLCDRI